MPYLIVECYKFLTHDAEMCWSTNSRSLSAMDRGKIGFVLASVSSLFTAIWTDAMTLTIWLGWDRLEADKGEYGLFSSGL